MALVPFRVSGPAASQQLDQQLLQIGPHSLLLQQRPGDSGNTAHLQQQARQDIGTDQSAAGAADNAAAGGASAPAPPDLSRVGLVLWQSGFVLSDFLLRHLPALQPDRWSSWAGVRVLELGSGAGTVGLFLALAGAQVVLTDLAHILPLTQQNLELNFPQLAAAQHSPAVPVQPSQCATEGSSSHTEGGSPAAAAAAAAAAGSFGRRGAATDLRHLETSRAAAGGGAAASEPLSAAAAFAAAFGTGGPDDAADAPPPPAADPCLWRVFGRGPLVAEHSWGEPVQQLRSRVEAAAAARITVSDAGGLPGTPEQQLQQQQQGGSARVVMPAALHSYDAVVGADLLYDPLCHARLLATLDAVCSAHTQVFLCFRVRGLGEEAFEAAAAAAGWALQVAPPHVLHEEFQGGDYRLLCLSKID